VSGAYDLIVARRKPGLPVTVTVAGGWWLATGVAIAAIGGGATSVELLLPDERRREPW